MQESCGKNNKEKIKNIISDIMKKEKKIKKWCKKMERKKMKNQYSNFTISAVLVGSERSPNCTAKPK